MKEQTRVKTIRLRQEARQTEVLKPVGAARPAEWIDASKKKDGFSRLLRADRLIRNLAAAAGLMLVAVAVKNAELPQSQSVFSALEDSLNPELDESVGKLSFVDSLLPAEVQEVWRQAESVTVFEPVRGSVVHAWSRQEPYLELSCNTTDVRAAADGEIMSIAHGPDEERIVRIRHEGGLETLYGNLESCAHEVGDRVCAGDPFATVLEGAPLAFELRRDGRSIDPAGLLLPLTE